jgi:cellulose synthase/poly-beta-1,6-N-acetylglucosamine synthase-like glycosyltransferase
MVRFSQRSPGDTRGARTHPVLARALRWVALVAGAAAVGAVAEVATERIHTGSLLYILYIAVSLVLGAIASTTLVWMLHAWRTPSSLVESRLAPEDLEPAHSFSLIVPARHEEAVLETTLSRLVTSDHPDFEILVVVGTDDPATREVAERVAERYPELVKVVVDASWPKNKPKALNAALPYCTGAITGVFDAEDDVHPALLQRVDQCFQRSDADVVQAGVQLMNFRSSWLTVRNVLEYYFWFRSRLHRHAGQGFVPLGGNTVFVRTQVLRAVSGWDGDCLAEDCELGVRLSALGAHTAVFYEPELVTREECPPTLGAFARQRTRWNQGYLQTLSKGYWRRLPLRQRTLGGYILAMPYLMALAWVLMPIALATAVAVNAPVPITLISFAPVLPMLSMLAVEIAGLGEFCRAYGERASARDYGRLILGLPLYQAVLAFAAARAVVREARGNRGWEKTAHLGLHLTRPTDADGAPSDGSLEVRSRQATRSQPRHAASGGLVLRRTPLARSLTPSLATSNGNVELSAGSVVHEYVDALSEDRGNGNGHAGREWRPTLDDLFAAAGGEPLWMRLGAMPANGSASLSPGGLPAVLARPGSGRLRGVRALLGRFAGSRVDVVVLLVVLMGVGIAQATNMLHWPGAQFDEGTYVGNAWAIQERGALAFYTYTYGHPPLAWILIFLWTWASGIFGHGGYSLAAGREAMFAVSMVSCWLVYILARRLAMGPVFAAGAVILFALSPIGLFFHRAVLLDNPATAWALAAFVLALSPRRNLWSFAGSGACLAASALSKETTLVLLPALVVAAAQNLDRGTRRYCMTLFVCLLGLLGLAYPLYATLKGELLPGSGHVSLFGTLMDMLFLRQGTGSVLNPHSIAHGTVTFWLNLDPWLLGGALLLVPVAVARRKTRAIAFAFVIQVVMILRPGYLPGMYVTAMLPFAALIVAGSAETLWRFAIGEHPRRRRPAGQAWWRVIGSRAAGLLTAVAIGACGLAVGALAATAAFVVAPRWVQADRAAMTVRLDGPQRAAERWLLQNVGHDQRLIVTDEFWVYLITHGFDSHRMRGGFSSRTVISYWPLDKDPAVKRYFPHGWRDFDYIVSTQDMRNTAIYTPNTAQALQRSRVVARFGSGGPRIEVRAIDRAGPP